MSLKDSIKKFLFKPEATGRLSLTDKIGSGPARRPVRYSASRKGESAPFVRPWETGENQAREYEGGQVWSTAKGRKS